MSYTVWVRVGGHPERRYSTEHVMCPIVRIDDKHIYFNDRSSYSNEAYGKKWPQLNQSPPPPLEFNTLESAWEVAKRYVTIYIGEGWFEAAVNRGWVEVRKGNA